MPAIVGEQQPRVLSLPEPPAKRSDLAKRALECCQRAELELDPWQEFVLEQSLVLRGDKWAAFEVGLNVARQNGKGAILEARELVGMYVLQERLIVHSAHEFATSLEAFRRLLWLLEDKPEFEGKIKRVSRAHGEEGVELHGGARIRFRTRTKGGGRGFSADCLILDEAMFIPEFAHGALLPTLSARPNPQVWYTGSAVDQEVHDNGVVFARVRERGHAGDDPSLAYFEWSVNAGNPLDLDEEYAATEAAWAQANPGLGYRIQPEHISYERRSMDSRTFAVERLGVGDWPRTDGLGDLVIDPETWSSLIDARSEAVGPVAYTFDVTPGRERSTIAKVGRRADGLMHVEVVAREAGTGWLVDELERIERTELPLGIVCDSVGPAASLLPELELRNVTVTAVTTPQLGQACGMFFDVVDQRTLRHLGTPELTSAIKGAAKRPLGDRWAWSRKNSTTDISPLVAATLGVWLVVTEELNEPLFAFG